MRLISDAFVNGGLIPAHHTVRGEDLSPMLAWRDAPAETKSYVLLVDDRDAPLGARAHWAAYDIPVHHCALTEGAGQPAGFEDFRHAVNDFGRLGYSGPRARHFGTHHYRFRLLALSCAALPLRTHPDCAEVREAARPFILAVAEIFGVFVPEKEQGARAG